VDRLHNPAKSVQPRISTSPRPWWSMYSSATADETVSRSPMAKMSMITRAAASASLIHSIVCRCRSGQSVCAPMRKRRTLCVTSYVPACGRASSEKSSTGAVVRPRQGQSPAIYHSARWLTGTAGRVRLRSDLAVFYASCRTRRVPRFERCPDNFDGRLGLICGGAGQHSAESRLDNCFRDQAVTTPDSSRTS